MTRKSTKNERVSNKKSEREREREPRLQKNNQSDYSVNIPKCSKLDINEFRYDMTCPLTIVFMPVTKLRSQNIHNLNT